MAIIRKKLYYVLLTVADFGFFSIEHYEFLLTNRYLSRIAQIYSRQYPLSSLTHLKSYE